MVEKGSPVFSLIVDINKNLIEQKEYNGHKKRRDNPFKFTSRLREIISYILK